MENILLKEPVDISARAAEEIKLIMQSDDIPDNYCLRIGVDEGGCGSGGFAIGFDAKKESDLHYIKQGIPVVVDKKHLMHVVGKLINYSEEGEKWGFVFDDKAVQSNV